MYSWFHLTAQSKSILFSTSGRRTTRGLLASTKGKNNHKPPWCWTRALMQLFKSLGTSNSNLWLKARLVLSKPSESSVHFKQIWVHWEQWTTAVWPRNIEWEQHQWQNVFYTIFTGGWSGTSIPTITYRNFPFSTGHLHCIHVAGSQIGKYFAKFLWRWILSRLSGIFMPDSFRGWIDSLKILVSNF